MVDDKSINGGTYAWFGLVGYVILADAILYYMTIKKKKINTDTMSAVFNQSLTKPRTKFIIPAVWSLLTLHLFKPYLPSKIQNLDPITGFGRFIANQLE